jgi:hypothetical protein
MKLPTKTITRAVSERVGGKKPSPVRAGVTAVAAGGAVGAVVYRTLRN